MVVSGKIASRSQPSRLAHTQESSSAQVPPHPILGGWKGEKTWVRYGPRQLLHLPMMVIPQPRGVILDPVVDQPRITVFIEGKWQIPTWVGKRFMDGRIQEHPINPADRAGWRVTPQTTTERVQYEWNPQCRELPGRPVSDVPLPMIPLSPPRLPALHQVLGGYGEKLPGVPQVGPSPTPPPLRTPPSLPGAEPRLSPLAIVPDTMASPRQEPVHGLHLPLPKKETVLQTGLLVSLVYFLGRALSAGVSTASRVVLPVVMVEEKFPG